jgi:FKBP-type peptidyl-prolyl cis-trans isomerase SlyD
VHIASRTSLTVLACLAALLPASLRAEDAAKPAVVVADPAPAAVEPGVVAAGRRVSIQYTLTTDDGKVADTNVGGEALVYEQGKSEILPALEQALAGLKKGESKKVTLTPDQGYGIVKPELMQTIPTEKIPEDARKAGTMLMAQSQTGEQRPVRVHEVKGEEIVIDMNHPLAGKALHFDVKVLEVE